MPNGHLSFRDTMGLEWRRQGANDMSKERKSNKEVKKKAALTPKEKKALKKAKKEATKSSFR